MLKCTLTLTFVSVKRVMMDAGATSAFPMWFLGAYLRITGERGGDEVSLWGELLFCFEGQRQNRDGP